MDKKEELELIKQKILPILKSYKISKAGIFGSYARGEQKKKSDIDILVEVNKNMGLLEFIDIKIHLEKTLKRKVDLVEYATIRKEIKDNILNDEITILS